MSVIIRLQNLPWTANARDIRNFFTGLAIPEGGVHIIGGEMGDAFIAFSTDEDARCAMLKDREKLMEVQVRLLLSSRAEMQKVIETARKVSTTPTPNALNKPEAAVAMPPVPQPPIIGGLNSFVLSQQQTLAQAQAQSKQLTQVAPLVGAATTPNFLAYQKQAGITLADIGGGLKVASQSPEQGLFSSRRRFSRSRSHSRSSSSDDSDHSRDRRLRKRRPEQRSDSNEREIKVQPQKLTNLSPWASVAPATNLPGLSNVPGLQQQMGVMSVLPPVLQSYSTNSNITTNNYNLNIKAAPQQQLDLVLAKNPTALQQHQKPESIAFASVNPYAQIYPQLFQQQQQILLQQQTTKTSPGIGSSPGSGAAVAPVGGSGVVSAVGGSSVAVGVGLSGPVAKTCYIKISGMCPTTSYSDLRKYFAGLYIPHNGIKIVNGANGARMGIAYIEFSRVSSAQKALARNNTLFRDRLVQIEPIGDEEFEQADERAQRASASAQHSGSGNGSGIGRAEDHPTAAAAAVSGSVSATNVLYVEDLPQLTTEQDIMKMFSATYTIVDILLAPSPNNRREFISFVLFARDNEARSALEDTSRHYIGFRKLRVRASSQAEMQIAKDKQRRASEQLQKEEQQQREDAEREHVSKQQQLQLQQRQQELLAIAKFNNDPRRRNEMQQQHIHNNNINNNNNHNNLPPFANSEMHNGNLPPFAFHHQNGNNNNNNNNMGMNMNMHNNNINNNNNNNMGPFGMQQHHNNNNNNNNQQLQQMQLQMKLQQHQQQLQLQQQMQGNPRRVQDVFVRVHNCEYATRINDLGELFVSENLRIEHIEMLFNDRQQSAGEFIVEFSDAHNAKLAIREFHNRRFRGRGLRLSPITPQEIADRMNKPFMDYLPGGNGPRQSDQLASLAPPMQQQHQHQQQQPQPPQQPTRRRGPSRFNDISNKRNSQQQSLPPTPASVTHDSDDSNSSKQQHFNPFAVRGGPELNLDEITTSSPIQTPSLNNNKKIKNNGVDSVLEDDGIPDKFNRPACVVAMRNVPFKADLKDILRFFSDYKLSPDDIIRRFNDEGKPTGDARVAFESSTEARSAFESRRRKQIFGRTVYLDII